MKTIIHILQTYCTNAIQNCKFFSTELHPYLPAEITQSVNHLLGNYQCNSALKMARIIKRPPGEIAEAIVAAFPSNAKNIVESISCTSGFINFTISPKFLALEISNMLHDKKLGIEMPKDPCKIIVEFSSPNVAKELHVGHLRSTIIGDSIARLFEFLGHRVIRLNHVGDWGTQFGMLLAFITEKNINYRHLTSKQLLEIYQAAKQEFDNNPSFKKKAHQEVIALQKEAPTSIEIWKSICQVSRKAYQEIYDLLDIKITERGESYYRKQLPIIIQDLRKKDLTTESQGATCIFFEEFTSKEGDPLPIIVQKSDGGYNYVTTDLAAMRQRTEEEKVDRIIVVTDGGQLLHFQMVIRASIAAGYLDPKKTEFNHVTFGVVLSPEKKRLKTREGTSEKLIDLIHKAIQCAKTTLKERRPDFSEKEINNSSKILGIDAIKYADLSGHRQKDYIFSYERMLQFEGNTAPYLLYSYVRMQGIKRKVNKSIKLSAPILLEHPSEIALALHLRQFDETLFFMSRDLLPNRLAEYLYHLAEKFHAFFRDCRVEGSDSESSRLSLCECSSRVLKQGLEILGLKTLDKM